MMRTEILEWGLVRLSSASTFWIVSGRNEEQDSL
jgi:hypothetical protein